MTSSCASASNRDACLRLWKCLPVLRVWRLLERCTTSPKNLSRHAQEHDFQAFLKGHRIRGQVQSTWFPVIDRIPQKFLPSVYQMQASDLTLATQRIYSTPGSPSRLNLPVMP
jgi:predicted acyl esterase